MAPRTPEAPRTPAPVPTEATRNVPERIERERTDAEQRGRETGEQWRQYGESWRR